MEDHEMIAVPFWLLRDLALECQNYNLSVRADNLLATVKDSFTVAKDQHARDSMELRKLCSERDLLKTKRDALLAFVSVHWVNVRARNLRIASRSYGMSGVKRYLSTGPLLAIESNRLVIIAKDDALVTASEYDQLKAELEQERQRRFDGNELNSKELTQLHAANQRLETENARLKSALASNTARRYVGDADQRTIDELVAAGIRVDQQEIKRLEAEVARLKGDAERYWWLNDSPHSFGILRAMSTGDLTGPMVDDAIDAAMQAAK